MQLTAVKRYSLEFGYLKNDNHIILRYRPEETHELREIEIISIGVKNSFQVKQNVNQAP